MAWEKAEVSHQEPTNWAAALQEAVGKLAGQVKDRWREEILLQNIAKRLALLERRVAAQEKAHPLTVPINTFAPEPFEVRQEIKAVVEQVQEDECLATFFDAGIGAAGSNPVEAVQNLKDILLSRFEFLDGLPPGKLGPIPAKQIAVLRCHIRRLG